ncbi:MAG: serine/threonine-protein kinase [Myxococcaceae bacterium]
MSVAIERDDWAGLLEDSEGLAEPALLAGPLVTSPPLLAPRQVLAGRFTIIRLIARGTLGVVYEARDEQRQMHVAVKTLHPRLAADSAAMDRLRSEVLLARRLRHPSVCRVFEVYALRTPAGEPLHFLTRQLLSGASLAERMARRGPFEEEEALPLVCEMVDALAEAHALALVHRDFKPSNVLLVPPEEGSIAERVVVTDFGIARALLPDRRRTEPLPALAVDLLDSLDHLAPEQLSGGPVGPAADVYSLGVVLHQMMTGRLPAVHPLGPLADSSVVPPVALVPELSARWNDTILRCLERTPGRRFQDAREIARELAQ